MSAVSLTITIDRDQLMHKTALVKYCRLTLRVTMAPSKAGKGSNVTCTFNNVHVKLNRQDSDKTRLTMQDVCGWAESKEFVD
ncbi:hypothetical protein WN944_021553 [Citrus x changshan-huyou]|uniref:Uncharacterized protein n=1 Tax=Citrus x changshan-huyou TaxID=2935761 RepID=A0AAP0R2R5_9ROSI